MGASQKKKERIAARNNGEVKVNERELEAQKRAKTFKITAIVTIVVLVLCVALILFFKSDFIYHNVDAVTVDGMEFSVADYNYFRTAKINEYNSYFGDLSAVGDMITDDVIRDATLSSMKNTVMYYKMANEAGYTLSEDSQAKINDAVTTLQSYTNMSGMTLDAYLEANFGTGVDEEVYRKNAAIIALAQEYKDKLYKDLEYSDDVLEENYDPAKYDVIGFYLFTVYNSSQENKDTAAEDAKAKAEEFAAKVTDGDSFKKLVAEYANDYFKMLYKYDPSACLVHNACKSINDTYSEWLCDTSRQEGDIEVFSDDVASYVVMYVDRSENRYHPVSIREIYFPHNVTYSDYESDAEYEEAYLERLEATHTSCEQVYNNWLEGEKTEESFGKLAQSYNTAGTTGENGLIEVVMKNAYSDAIDEWCFDPARQEGDVEIIDTADGSYILYFIGEYHQTYRQYVVDAALRVDEFDAWEEENLANYEAKTCGGFRFVD